MLHSEGLDLDAARKLAIGSGAIAVARNRGSRPVLEAGHGADPFAGESEDEQAGSVADAGRGAQVGPERSRSNGDYCPAGGTERDLDRILPIIHGRTAQAVPGQRAGGVRAGATIGT
jgi:hypothetical protein